VAQEEGHTRGDSKILYDARVAPPTTVLHDNPCLVLTVPEVGISEALEFVYGDCWWANRTSIKERIWDLQSLESDSRRKYLNQPVADEEAWVTPQEWAALTKADRVVADGEDIALFFDGSKSRDATALIGCCISDGHVFRLGVWEPDPKHTTESVVPVAAVDSAVIWAHEKYTVQAFFADVQEWQGFVKVTWPDRYKNQYVVMAAPSGREPASIAWDMRSHAYEFAEAAEVCHEEIVSGRFTHDGDSVIARHVGNARNNPHKGRMSVSKESPDSPRKIDAAVCVIGARMVRRLVIAAGPKKVRTNEAFFR
jgi:phage terminase large subunit-like protein